MKGDAVNLWKDSLVIIDENMKSIKGNIYVVFKFD